MGHELEVEDPTERREYPIYQSDTNPSITAVSVTDCIEQRDANPNNVAYYVWNRIIRLDITPE